MGDLQIHSVSWYTLCIALASIWEHYQLWEVGCRRLIFDMGVRKGEHVIKEEQADMCELLCLTPASSLLNSVSLVPLELYLSTGQLQTSTNS